MILAEIDKILIQLLKVCEVDEDVIIGTMLVLKEKNKVQDLINWIDKNPMCTQEQILKQAVII